MEIQLGDSCKLRCWSRDDIPSLVRYANNRSVWLNLMDKFPHPYGEDDARDWIGIVGSQKPTTNFAIAFEDEAIGGIGFTLQADVHFRSAEAGYWLAEPFWGRGIATLALKPWWNMPLLITIWFGYMLTFSTGTPHRQGCLRKQDSPLRLALE